MIDTFFSRSTNKLNNSYAESEFKSSRGNHASDAGLLNKILGFLRGLSVFNYSITSVSKLINNQPIFLRCKALLLALLSQKAGFILASIGMAVSGYSIFRLSTDSHLICVANSQTGEYSVAQVGMSQNNATSQSENTQKNLDAINGVSGDSSEGSSDDEKKQAISQDAEVTSSSNQLESQIEAQKQLTDENSVVIDVAGAVKKPGLYKVPANSRIGDVLSMAGGISVQASAVEVSQAINLASKVKDGQKIYVPFIGEDLSEILKKELSFGSLNQEHTTPNAQNRTEQTTKDTSSSQLQKNSGEITQASANLNSAGLTDSTSEQNLVVSINSATATRLMELKGIGEKRAADIIAGRPYGKIEELLSKGILTQGIYSDIFNQLKL